MGIEQEIRREARRQILRHEARTRQLREENRRRSARSTNPGRLLPVIRPQAWTVDPGFDPYIVRARAQRIAPSIRTKLEGRDYRPRAPLVRSIPKQDGGKRMVNEYQVADAAVSKMMFERLLKKNAPVLSARAYAYRKDVSAQDAIQYIRSEFRNRTRIFVAEYDFRSYFDSVSHDNILQTLNDHFLVTEIEQSAIVGFLTTDGSEAKDYTPSAESDRERGIPQGTSISLFLANVAAWNLDRILERLGVSFTRYADDTLIWSTSYARVCEAVERLHEQARTIGVRVNPQKSPGVRLLVADGASAEIAKTDDISYLGYCIGISEIDLKESAKERIRKRLANLIYWSLVREPQNGTQNLARLGDGIDRDYVSVIWRMRRYLYGDLSEKAVRRFQHGEIRLRRFKGVMSAYPLLDDTPALRALDSWILDQLFLAMRKRTKLLANLIEDARLPVPHGIDRNNLRSLRHKSRRTGETFDLTVPSVRRMAAAIRNSVSHYGPSAVGRFDSYED